jgi:DNA-binding NarL/FixJ family response regulator
MKVHKNQSEVGCGQKPLTVLLVDDNPTFLATVNRTLQMLSHVQVLGQALDGRQALALAQELQPDLVLLDIVMPEFSGLEVAQIMLGWPKSPKVLFLSMHDNDSYRSLAKKLGAVGLVGKANFVAELLPILVSLSNPAMESRS